MKNIYFLLLSALLATACNEKRSAGSGSESQPGNPPLPAVLEENGSSESYSLRKRSVSDMVMALYSELKKTDPEIRELENQLELLQESVADSTATFSDFNSKNQSYYQSAKEHAGRIGDSVLKEKLLLMVNADSSRYATTIAPHQQLMSRIEAGQQTLADLHEYLVVFKTLPIIRQYQNGNLPPTHPLAEFLKNLEKTISKAQGMTAK
ncbi:MAG: hypothetical protein EOO09_19520 [Chitinophagaceae bacterium]|nr:MAG: hypothetical protein EOO09_19520 [Chitinophagaceae bacterium]